MATADTALGFLGVGWAFPPGMTPAGRPDEASYEEDVRQAILIVLGTSPGERLMRPSFGAGLDRLLFEPAGPATAAAAQARVRAALIAWEPRIEVEGVAVTPRAGPPALLDIDVTYRVRATNSRQNLVYPFYLEEGSPR
jgi:Bacteriophage baseplate protein W